MATSGRVTIYRSHVTNTRLDTDLDLSPFIAEIGSRLQQRLGDLSSEMRVSLEEDIPELRGDAGLEELLGASVHGNVDTILRALRYDIALEHVQAPTAAMEYARRLAQRGVPVHALVRAYRLGQRRMNEFVFGELTALELAPDVKLAVVDVVTGTLFDYIDWISQQVVVVYEDERERWLENQNSIRALRVREVLTGKKPVDIDAVTTTIRYPLRWHHLALVMWYQEGDGQGDELARLQRFLRDVGAAAQVAASPLFVAADQVSAWGWLPFKEAFDAIDVVRRFALARADCPNVAIGVAAQGVEGFRRSHREADVARRVAISGGMLEPAIVAATDPGLSVAAQFGGDIVRAREWVADALADLATDTENDARLRETLRVFLRCGGSYKTAAEELGMHFNSVKYRINRAVARRGRPIEQDRLDVELALVVCQWYGAAVLMPDMP
ncbi:MAG: helix-turn-helix domain-containing protein [Mycolicibacterium sp.]|nr:helix-turn-helix domain-containing protein [Mycolicibacterium sp.]